MRSLRLLLFEECNRACPGCVNKDWDLNALEVETSFDGYDEIILTGGEPMLRPDLVIDVVEEIRKKTDTKIYMYTAKVDKLISILSVLKILDGITVTLHNKGDLKAFKKFNELLDYCRKNKFGDYIDKSFRLNVFKGIDITDIDTSAWKVKSEIKWIRDCPLPVHEVFKRYQKNGLARDGTIQLARDHTRYLEIKFEKNYPDGQFALQRIKPSEYRIHWSPYRTTRNSFRGITVRWEGGKIRKKGCGVHNTGVGKWNYYKDIDMFLAAAGRFKCPQELVEVFIERHKNWKE